MDTRFPLSTQLLNSWVAEDIIAELPEHVRQNCFIYLPGDENGEWVVLEDDLRNNELNIPSIWD
jgi:hypothetical protein